MSKSEKTVLDKPQTWYMVSGDRVEAIEVVAYTESTVWCNNTGGYAVEPLHRLRTTNWYRIVQTFEEARALVKADLKRQLRSAAAAIENAKDDIETLEDRLSHIDHLVPPALPRPFVHKKITAKEL